MNRVVITGIGVISPVGCTLAEFWSALVDARSGIRPIQGIPTERLSTACAAQALSFDAQARLGPRRANAIDRFAQFAVCAARDAVVDAGLHIDEELALEVATIIGTGIGGQTSLDAAYLKLYGENSPFVHPLTVPRLMANAAPSHVSIDLGLKGAAYSVSTACASGTHAVGQAFHLIRSGAARIAIAGGTEACISVGGIKAWEALHVLSNDTCRPFSKTRSGLVLGEGAAVLVLEARDHAMARGASIYAEVRGFGMSADAVDMVSPDIDGAVRAMQAALRDASCNADEIDYVNAHGTGTTLNDKAETSALRCVFGAHAGNLAVSSNKGVLAHSLGAAGALEAAATALTLRHQIVPPTANYQEPDPECDLDVVPNIARSMPLRTAMSNSFAFGSLNAVLVLGRA